MLFLQLCQPRIEEPDSLIYEIYDARVIEISYDRILVLLLAKQYLRNPCKNGKGIYVRRDVAHTRVRDSAIMGSG
jgi:hypothetical protein